jgi:hypothetical protein
MSDRFKEAAKEYLQAPIYEWTTQEMIQEELERFARWYEDKYLQEALTAAAMMKLHEEKTCECEKRGKTFECWGYCPYCGRRIKEAK